MQPLRRNAGAAQLRLHVLCFTTLWNLRFHRYHQYKFIVDGTWRHDETQPYMPDPLGNVNNWLFVRRPEGCVRF